ncbi:MAG: hypothetical protein M3R48_09520, partial [Candidatus Dormibacteraeota bacterium]|nr:hypothetical protein [Candidatus Dormibacteraeota bacterium]
AYVDKRSRRCATAWCVEHGREVGDQVFCRRHASTVAAMTSADMVYVFPDLDNRAPSLVGLVAGDIDAVVRELLLRSAPGGTTVVSDPVRLVVTPGTTVRRWSKSWRLLDHISALRRASIGVDEGGAAVSAWVDTDLIGGGVPPWISARVAGRTVTEAEVATQRREFAAGLERSIELVLTRSEVLPRH